MEWQRTNAGKSMIRDCNDFANHFREYFARNYWLNSKIEGSQIKKQSLRALEQDDVPAAKATTSSSTGQAPAAPRLLSTQSNGVH